MGRGCKSWVCLSPFRSGLFPPSWLALDLVMVLLREARGAPGGRWPRGGHWPHGGHGCRATGQLLFVPPAWRSAASAPLVLAGRVGDASCSSLGWGGRRCARPLCPAKVSGRASFVPWEELGTVPGAGPAGACG